MDRRTVLVAVATLAAGCNATGGDDDAPARTPVSGEPPADRQFDGRAVAADGHALTFRSYHALESVRYSASEGGYEAYEPAGGRVVVCNFELSNVGEEPVSAMADSRIRLRVDGEEYDHAHSLGGEIEFRQVDQPDGEPSIRPLAWYERLEPGESVALQLVFEPVDCDPAAPHYLVWDHDVAVEGADDPVYLLSE